MNNELIDKEYYALKIEYELLFLEIG